MDQKLWSITKFSDRILDLFEALVTDIYQISKVRKCQKIALRTKISEKLGTTMTENSLVY
jgi:hypothetical protein